MTLATHAVVGAAAASLFPAHPVIAFTAAFASHFAIDAIPHWHYALSSLEVDPEDMLKTDMAFDRRFPFDLAKIAFDALLGLALSLAVFHLVLRIPLLAILIGVAGGILPDPLQFVYWKWRHQPLEALQRFHIWVHAKKHFDKSPLLGISMQTLLMLLVMAGRKFNLI